MSQPKPIIKTPEQIEGIRQAGRINTAVLDAVADCIRPGLSTADIDRVVWECTFDHRAIPACLGYDGFPRSCCTSINDVVCHGIPCEEEVLHEGDIINVDVTTIKDGYFADASRMFVIGTIPPRWQQLVDCARECLEIGARAARPHGHVGDIGHAIERHARGYGFSVVRDLAGHGTGLRFHEAPDVNHYGRANTGAELLPGMVFTIEPMINMGSHEVFLDEDDGWTVLTEDGLPSAQWEHTFLMTETGLEILTY